MQLYSKQQCIGIINAIERTKKLYKKEEKGRKQKKTEENLQK